MSHERKLIMYVFLFGAVDDPTWRENDATSYYRMAQLAGIPRRQAATMTHAQAVDALAEFQSELTKERADGRD